MGFLDMLFGYQRKIRKLRKAWDRKREKALKKEEPIKSMCLEKLDRTEEKLRMIEERRMHRMERERFAKEIEIELAEISGLLDSKPEEMRGMQQTHNQQNMQNPQRRQQRPLRQD